MAGGGIRDGAASKAGVRDSRQNADPRKNEL
jgi:hypothetical protein